jgi:hypothetical protein
VTTTTIIADKTDSLQSQQYIGILSVQEDSNVYWVDYYRRKVRGFNLTALSLSPETAFKQPQNTLVSEEDIVNIPQHAITEHRISLKNLKAIRILNQWFAEPDEHGAEFWNEFCENLERNRFKISR